MSAATWLGQSFRRLGSLGSARVVRSDDAKRAERQADVGMLAVRAKQIEAEALRIAAELGEG